MKDSSMIRFTLSFSFKNETSILLSTKTIDTAPNPYSGIIEMKADSHINDKHIALQIM